MDLLKILVEIHLPVYAAGRFPNGTTLQADWKPNSAAATQQTQDKQAEKTCGWLRDGDGGRVHAQIVRSEGAHAITRSQALAEGYGFH